MQGNALPTPTKSEVEDLALELDILGSLAFSNPPRFSRAPRTDLLRRNSHALRGRVSVIVPGAVFQRVPGTWGTWSSRSGRCEV